MITPIELLVPFRSNEGKRMTSLERMLKSWKETTEGSSSIVILLDTDDEQAIEFLYENYPHVLHLSIPARQGSNFVTKLNLYNQKLLGKSTITGVIGDDFIFKTENWESTLIDHTRRNKVAVMYGNDLLQGEVLPTAPFITSNIIRALGYIAPWSIQHLYSDNFWKDLGIRLNCLKYFPEMIIEHAHWSIGKAEKDKQYERVAALDTQDRAAFDEYREKLFDKEIERVKGILKLK
jgi:hypothetical protein